MKEIEDTIWFDFTRPLDEVQRTWLRHTLIILNFPVWVIFAIGWAMWDLIRYCKLYGFKDGYLLVKELSEECW